MGAGASTADPQEEIRTIRKGQVAEDASAGAILVKSASGLTKSSGWLDEPDPYAMTRLGPVGSSWADKDTPEACERTSCVASDTRDPVWQLAFPYALPAADVAWELHVRVYDKDYASFDDFLGEARVPLAALAEHENATREYALTDKSDGATVGALTLMMGDAVETALMEEHAAELAALSESGAQRGLLSTLVSPTLGVAARVGCYFADWFTTPEYASLIFGDRPQPLMCTLPQVLGDARELRDRGDQGAEANARLPVRVVPQALGRPEDGRGHARVARAARAGLHHLLEPRRGDGAARDARREARRELGGGRGDARELPWDAAAQRRNVGRGAVACDRARAADGGARVGAAAPRQARRPGRQAARPGRPVDARRARRRGG